MHYLHTSQIEQQSPSPHFPSHRSQTFLLQITTEYTDGSTHVMKTIPCDIGSSTDICWVEVCTAWVPGACLNSHELVHGTHRLQELAVTGRNCAAPLSETTLTGIIVAQHALLQPAKTPMGQMHFECLASRSPWG